MKIIICCLNLYGGGAERVASLWAKGFHNQGHDVVMFLAENKVSYDISDIPIVLIGNGLPAVKQYIHWYKLFREEFNRIIPDVFISVNHPWAIIAKVAALGTNIKVISTEHNAYEKPDYISMSLFDRLHKFLFNRFVDRVTVLTQADKDYIGGRIKNVYVLPNPLTFTPTKKMPNKEKTILAVGRLDSWHVKGFDLLINAWKALATDYLDWKLRIIGYGTKENRQYLQSIANGISTTQFEILDFDYHIIEQYKHASIFVLSSRYEGFGMVLVEAMSQGCACIACDYKGRQREIIADGVDGLIARVDDVDDIKAKLETLICDKKLQTLLQTNAIEKSMCFSLESVMKIWSKIIK